MQKHNFIQGSPEWHAHRRTHFNASDAPAMMGVSSYKTRDQLIKELATGITEEVTPELQAIFDGGHRAEALYRPRAEAIIGEELYPVVGSEGRLSASFDGLTMMDDVNFEHKKLNARLREAMFQGCTGADLPLEYQVQCEQQSMVSGCEKTLFAASNWDADGNLLEERFCWYYPNPVLASAIEAGWAKLEADVCAYVAKSDEVKPVGKAPETLPALVIRVQGAVLESNLSLYKEHALAVFASIKTELKTDQDFVDADKTVKWCGEVEDRLEAAKSMALGQTASIEALFNTIDSIKEEARQVRLKLEKLVKTEKETRRAEVVTSYQAKLDDVVAGLNEGLGANWIPRQIGDFAGAIKGKKSIDSCEAAAQLVLVEATLNAGKLASRLSANRKHLKQGDQDWFFLFADFATVGAKEHEDFAAIAALRIQQHRQNEADRKAREAEANLRAAVLAIKFPEPEAQPAPAHIEQVASISSPAVEQCEPAQYLVRPANTAAVISVAQLQERLGGMSVTGDFITGLCDQHGIKPVPQPKRPGKFFLASDFPRICDVLIAHIQKCKTTPVQPKAKAELATA